MLPRKEHRSLGAVDQHMIKICRHRSAVAQKKSQFSHGCLSFLRAPHVKPFSFELNTKNTNAPKRYDVIAGNRKSTHRTTCDQQSHYVGLWRNLTRIAANDCVLKRLRLGRQPAQRPSCVDPNDSGSGGSDPADPQKIKIISEIIRRQWIGLITRCPKIVTSCRCPLLLTVC